MALDLGKLTYLEVLDLQKRIDKEGKKLKSLRKSYKALVESERNLRLREDTLDNANRLKDVRRRIQLTQISIDEQERTIKALLK